MNLNSLSKINLRDRFEYGEHLRPLRDWMIMLSVAGVLLIASAAWNAWTFYRAWTGESVGADAIAPGVMTNEIEAAKKVFEMRALEESRYEGEYHFVDPS